MPGRLGQAHPRIDLTDATSADAAALAGLNVASWRVAYAHMLPEAFLATLDLASREEHLRRRIADADTGQFSIVARAGRRRLGFIAGGPTRDEPPALGGEVYAIYVDPARWNRGVGSALLNAAEARLGRAGFSCASIWVFTRNTRARRFYERHEWRLEPIRGFWQRDGIRRQLVCYSKALAPR